MKHLFFLVFTCSSALLSAQHLLVFSKTNGYRHESISAGQQAIIKLAVDNNMTVTFSEDSTLFETGILKRIDVLIFLSTNGDVFNDRQEKAIETFIKNGGGFVGIHCATCTEYSWNWYGGMIGTYFDDHPEIQEATLRIQDTTHLSTKELPLTWVKTDEWYNFKSPLPDWSNVLITIDEASYQGGTMGADHPISWYHEYDGGRVFYTALGHTIETYTDPLFLEHLMGGILWAMQEN